MNQGNTVRLKKSFIKDKNNYGVFFDKHADPDLLFGCIGTIKKIFGNNAYVEWNKSDKAYITFRIPISALETAPSNASNTIVLHSIDFKSEKKWSSILKALKLPYNASEISLKCTISNIKFAKE